MGFRNDEQASRARADALEQELARTKGELERVRAGTTSVAATGVRPGRAIALGAATVGVVLVGAALWCGFGWSGYVGERVGAVLGAAGCMALVLAALTGTLSAHLIVPAPHQAVVVSGRPRRRPDGTVVGYRVAVGRRVLVLPIVEQARVLDLRAESLDLSLPKVVVRRGGAVGIDVNLVFRIGEEGPLLDNAIERFLGRDPAEVRALAAQTVEAAIRAIAVKMDAETVAEEQLKLAELVKEEVEQDLSKLGLVVDMLRFSRVSAPA